MKRLLFLAENLTSTLKSFWCKNKRYIIHYLLYAVIGFVIGIIICLKSPENNYRESTVIIIFQGESIIVNYLKIIGVFSCGVLFSFLVIFGRFFCFTPCFAVVFVGYRLGKAVIYLSIIEKVTGVLSFIFYELLLSIIAILIIISVVLEIKRNVTYVKLFGIDRSNRKLIPVLLRKAFYKMLFFYLFAFLEIVVIGGILQLIFVVL